MKTEQQVQTKIAELQAEADKLRASDDFYWDDTTSDLWSELNSRAHVLKWVLGEE